MYYRKFLRISYNTKSPAGRDAHAAQRKRLLKAAARFYYVFPISRTGGGKIEPGEKKIPQPEPGCMQARYWLRYSERKQFKTGSCFTPVFYLFSRL
ncbi:hypothetical protein CLOM621_05781 [Clostridium sp. M62/1]|nr:hypothetical protein CLOM621_05781 [Clostridium sp. M62/1]